LLKLLGFWVAASGSAPGYLLFGFFCAFQGVHYSNICISVDQLKESELYECLS
jgi:hypothetical protein